MQLLLVVFIGSLGLRSVRSNNGAATDSNAIQGNFHNFFDSIRKSDPQKSEIYRHFLEQDAAREQHAFDSLKGELLFAQERNAHKQRNFYPVEKRAYKRETNDIDKVLESFSTVPTTFFDSGGKKRRYTELGDGEVVDHRGTQPRIRKLKKFKRGKKITQRTKRPLNRRERWRSEKLQMRLAYSRTESYPAFETIPIRSEHGELPAWENDDDLRKILAASDSSEDADKRESNVPEGDEEPSTAATQPSVDRKRGNQLKAKPKKTPTRLEHQRQEKQSIRPTQQPTETYPAQETTPIHSEAGPLPDAGEVGMTSNDDEELKKILGEPYSSEDAEDYESSSASAEDYSAEDDESAEAQDSEDKAEKSVDSSGPLVDARNRRKGPQKGNKKPMGRRQLRWEKERMQLIYHATDKYPTPKPKSKRSKKERQRAYGGDGGTLDNDKELMSILGTLPPDSAGDVDEMESSAVKPKRSKKERQRAYGGDGGTLDSDQELMSMLGTDLGEIKSSAVAEDFSAEDEEEDDEEEDNDDDDDDDDGGGNSEELQPEPPQALGSLIDQDQPNEPSSGVDKKKAGRRSGWKDRKELRDQQRMRKKKGKGAKTVNKNEDEDGTTRIYDKRQHKGGRRVPRLKIGETKKGEQWAKDLKLDDIKGPKRVRNLIKFNDPDGW